MQHDSIKERYFYLAVLDGDTPEVWRPFQGKSMKVIQREFLSQPKIADLPDPPRAIYLGFGLTTVKRILNDDFSQVYGLILDGKAFLAEYYKGDRNLTKHVQLIITRATKQNAYLRSVGFSVCALLPEDSAGEDGRHFDALHNELTTILDGSLSELDDGRVFVVPCEKSFAATLKNELARFLRREPFLYIEGSSS